ncbi:MAG: response regulator [Clostridia bacterium]|nr:response regulator [Clostridia bacterium]
MYRVVLVDDEHLIVEGLSKVVKWESLGCQVVGTASDGREGLALIRQEKPDMVLTDIRMPNMDGLTMLAALQSEFPQMQVTVLTAYRDFDYAQRAINLGVCRYLLKPSKMNELEEAISTMKERLDNLPAAEEPPAEADPGEAGSFIVRAALDYMRQHCTERISLADVADHVYVSQWHLSKLINRHTGQSFFDLIGGMRIEKAKALLADPSMRVHAIAEQVGYNDVAHFSKSFKKIVGKTPGEFRDSLGKDK